jgi:hypothetical protein
MELETIKILLEKYFEGETSSAEEKQLRTYFSKSDCAPELQPYKQMFGYFESEKDSVWESTLPNETKATAKTFFSLSKIGIAASLIFFAGVLSFFIITNQEKQKNTIATTDLGTFDNPEEAFLETQKALALVSQKLNQGLEGVTYINEYQKTTTLIFKN